MNIYSLFVLLLCGYAWCSTVNNVRLVDHISYAINVITRTMNIVEERGWCNLKLPDYVQQLDESILVTPYRASLTYTNGFVSSIQHVDITQHTVQQVWHYNVTLDTTTVSVQGTLRMLDLAVGFDVIGHLEGDTAEYHYTAVYVHPLVSFEFYIIKDMFTNGITVTVNGIVPRTTFIPQFEPKDGTSDIFASAFDAFNVTAAGILAWGPEVFQPIIKQLVTEEIEFPTVCYNCAVS